jgi:hypothetical protein
MKLEIVVLFTAAALIQGQRLLSTTPIYLGSWSNNNAENLSFQWKFRSVLQTDPLTFFLWPHITTAEVVEWNRDSDTNEFEAMTSLLTDGVDLDIEFCITTATYEEGGSSGCIQKLESDIFQNQPGCTNGIDLEGNYIERIVLEVNREYDETGPAVHWFRNMILNIYGRESDVYEDNALATIGDFASMQGCTRNITRPLVITLQVHEDRWSWATAEFELDFLDKPENGTTVAATRMYGTRNMMDLLANGRDGDITICHDIIPHIRRCGGKNQRAFFQGQSGCYNGIDLRGNRVENVSLYLMEDADGMYFCPSIVVSGHFVDEELPEPPPCPYCRPSGAFQVSTRCYAMQLIWLSTFFWFIHHGSQSIVA